MIEMLLLTAAIVGLVLLGQFAETLNVNLFSFLLLLAIGGMGVLIVTGNVP